MINRPDWINYAYKKEPDIEMLKKALENEQWLITDRETKLKAIRLKYQAMTTVPTIIEKTMTPAQLYVADNPLWAVELTARGIERFVNREKYNGKLPKILFDDYYNNAIQGFYFDDNIDVASYYPTIITDLMKGF